MCEDLLYRMVTPYSDKNAISLKKRSFWALARGDFDQSYSKDYRMVYANMYLFTTQPHPHGHWQLEELLGNGVCGMIHMRRRWRNVCKGVLISHSLTELIAISVRTCNLYMSIDATCTSRKFGKLLYVIDRVQTTDTE